MNNKPIPVRKLPITAKIVRLISAVLCRVAPALAVKWTLKLFFSPFSKKRPPSEIPFYNSAKQSTYDFDGRKIALYEWGEGEKTIILVHGWGSRGTRLGHYAPILNEAGYRVISVDLPAHGASDGKTTNLPEVTVLLSQLHEKFAPVHAFIGHSFGGMAILTTIHHKKVKVSRATMIASPFSLDFMLDSFAEQVNITDKIKASALAAMTKQFKDEKDIDVFAYSPDRFAHEVGLPVLVFHDEEDPDVPYHQGLGYAKKLPNATFISSRGLGHRRILWDDNVIKTLMEFITQE